VVKPESTDDNWTDLGGIRSYGSTASRAGYLGSKHSTTELRPLIFEAKIRETRKSFDARRLYSA